MNYLYICEPLNLMSSGFANRGRLSKGSVFYRIVCFILGTANIGASQGPQPVSQWPFCFDFHAVFWAYIDLINAKHPLPIRDVLPLYN